MIFLSYLWINVANIKNHFILIQLRIGRLTEILQAVRCHILWSYSIYIFIKSFLDKKCLSLRNMESLKGRQLWWLDVCFPASFGASGRLCHYVTRLFKYIEKFHHQKKNWKFSDKNSNIFHISAQNIGHNLCFWAKIIKIMYTHVNPSFTI